jgi:hypothetical protein
MKLVEYSKIAINRPFSLKWALLIFASLALASCISEPTPQAMEQKSAPTTLPPTSTALSTATATPESAVTPTPPPSPTTTSTSTLAPSPTPELVLPPTPTVPLPEPRFFAAPIGTILAVQYRMILSETFSFDNPDRPYYHPRDSVVWAIPAEGEPYRWVDDGRDKIQMRASPDYSQVAYIVNSQDGESTSVWVADADGSNPRQLSQDHPADDAGGHVYLGGWSPDGQKLTYVFNYRTGWSGAALYVTDVSTKKVTKMNVERVYGVTWVNNRLLQVHQYGDEITDIDIYTQEITPVTESLPLLVPGEAVEYDQTPGSEKITVYAADGSELYQLDLSGWPIWRSTLSPDLKWFIINVPGGKTKPIGIYKVGKDHPQPQLLLQGIEFSYESEIGRVNMDTNLYLGESWSPDSQWFLVLNYFKEENGEALYAINAETNEIKTVMELEAAGLGEGIDPVVWLK